MPKPALDVLAFSSMLAAAVGFSLCLAVGSSLDATASPESTRPVQNALLVGLGAFIIYNLDRLRDTHRDRTTSPARTEFVERYRGALTLSLALAAILFGGLLVAAPRDIAGLCIAIGAIGFFHRRLKKGAAAKALYVSTLWLFACLGLPWLSAGQPREGPIVAAILFPVLLANLIASNLRDGEPARSRHRPGTLLAVARGLALLAVGFALFAAPAQRPLAWIPLTEWIALVGFRRDERYGLLVIDGALLAGSLASLAHLALI